MSWLSSFFKSPKQPKAHDAWTPLQQQQLLNPMVSQAGQALGTTFGTGVNPYAYPGQYAAGPSALQQQAWSMAPQIAQQQMAGYGAIASGQPSMDALYEYQGLDRNYLSGQLMNNFGGEGVNDAGGAVPGYARAMNNLMTTQDAQRQQFQLQNTGNQLQALGGLAGVPAAMSGLGMDQYNVASNQLAGQQQQWNAMYNPYASPQYQAGMNLLGFNNPAATQGQPGGMGYSMVQSGLGSLMNAGMGWLTGGIL